MVNQKHVLAQLKDVPVDKKVVVDLVEAYNHGEELLQEKAEQNLSKSVLARIWNVIYEIEDRTRPFWE